MKKFLFSIILLLATTANAAGITKIIDEPQTLEISKTLMGKWQDTLIYINKDECGIPELKKDYPKSALVLNVANGMAFEGCWSLGDPVSESLLFKLSNGETAEIPSALFLQPYSFNPKVPDIKPGKPEVELKTEIEI